MVFGLEEVVFCHASVLLIGLRIRILEACGTYSIFRDCSSVALRAMGVSMGLKVSGLVDSGIPPVFIAVTISIEAPDMQTTFGNEGI